MALGAYPMRLLADCRVRAAVYVVAALVITAADARGQTAANVAVVINELSPESRQVGEYYIKARDIPATNVIRIRTTAEESISQVAFGASIQAPIAAALQRANLVDRVLYIVLTKGIPLRVLGTAGAEGTVSSVDSELTLLYRRLTGRTILTRGKVANPYYLGAKPISEAAAFTHRDHDIYLVSRLDAFTVDEAISLIVKGTKPSRDGRIVLDQRDALVNRTAEDWMALAAQNLTKAGFGSRVTLETTPKPARDVSPVIGYFSWGSTDPQNRTRVVKMDFSPGALAATFVSTDARTFKEPPANWVPTNVNDPAQFFGGSPQSLVGDLIREGATGVAGQVAEPYLESAVRPDVLFPAYLAGFNLIESFYLAIPHLSWQTIVVGDPLCAPFARAALSRADIDPGLDTELDLPLFFAKRRVEVAASTMPGTPERVVRMVVRGETLIGRGDRANARRVLEEAAEAGPTLAQPSILLAEIHQSSGEMDMAAERYRRVLAIQPNNSVALNNLAYDLAVRQKKPAEGRPLARKAQSVAPNEPTILDTVGWIEYLLGNTAEATKLLVQAARGAPLNPEIRLHAAFALASQGARAAAAAELSNALKLNPAYEKRSDVQELKGRLEESQN
jgi:uncharacterized protein (TIGR03790 family)